MEVFIQLNREDREENKEPEAKAAGEKPDNIRLHPTTKSSEVIIYSGNTKFLIKKRFEKPGKYYNPIISTLITDGAKLLLGLAELLLEKNYNKTIAYCDTDSLYVPPQHAKEIMEFFNSINPYDKELIPNLLKPDYERIWFEDESKKIYFISNQSEGRI